MIAFGKIFGMLSALLATLMLSSCAAGISQQDLLAQIQGGSPPLVLDVRTEREYREGHIPGAVNISIFDDFRRRFEKLDPPKERPIVVVCGHGPRASFAGFVLKLSGYESVYNLSGAMKEWNKNTLPAER